MTRIETVQFCEVLLRALTKQRHPVTTDYFLRSLLRNTFVRNYTTIDHNSSYNSGELKTQNNNTETKHPPSHSHEKLAGFLLVVLNLLFLMFEANALDIFWIIPTKYLSLFTSPPSSFECCAVAELRCLVVINTAQAAAASEDYPHLYFIGRKLGGMEAGTENRNDKLTGDSLGNKNMQTKCVVE